MDFEGWGGEFGKETQHKISIVDMVGREGIKKKKKKKQQQQ